MKIFILIFFSFFALTIKAQKTYNSERNNLLLKELRHHCKYPIKQQEKNKEAFVGIEYKVDNKGNITKRRTIICDDLKFKKATLKAFDKVKNRAIGVAGRTDTIYFQYKIQGSSTPIYPLTDITIIGYGSCNIPVLMK